MDDSISRFINKLQEAQNILLEAELIAVKNKGRGLTEHEAEQVRQFRYGIDSFSQKFAASF